MFKKLTILVLIIGIIVLFFLIPKEDVKVINEIDSIKYMHFGYSNGYAFNANISYDIENIDGKYMVTIKPYGISEEDAQTIEVNEDFINKVLGVINKYNLRKWDGFHKSDRNVLDGDSFSFTLRSFEDDYISASGYMMYPSNYRKVEEEFDTIFMSIYTGKIYE